MNHRLFSSFSGWVFAGVATVVPGAPSVAAEVISVRLSALSAQTVRPGQPFDLEVRADFDVPVTGFAYELNLESGPAVTLIARSADPQDDNGLSYLSSISQVPFVDGLPLNLSEGPSREVLFDADFDGLPGGTSDGVLPGNDVQLARLTLVGNEEGLLTISLAHLQAAAQHVGEPPRRFDEIKVEIGSVKILISKELPTCEGDSNGDDAVDPLDAGFVLARLGCTVGSGDAACDAADVNADGVVDPLDVGFVLARFGDCP